MATEIFADEVTKALADIQAAARHPTPKMVLVDSQQRSVPYPFPSPVDWRDCWIYMLMIDRFVGRHSTQIDGFGIDAALDFPLFYAVPPVAKAQTAVETVPNVFVARKQAEQGQLSSHGEAGRYFVSFLDNHDQYERFHHPATPIKQVTLGLGVLFSLQGIPCLYYGTEQGLTGTKDTSGNPVLDSFESVREALWDKGAQAFDQSHPLFVAV